jgi:hypothetical protein
MFYSVTSEKKQRKQSHSRFFNSLSSIELNDDKCSAHTFTSIVTELCCDLNGNLTKKITQYFDFSSKMVIRIYVGLKAHRHIQKHYHNETLFHVFC